LTEGNWPLWADQHPQTSTPATATCPSCGRTVAPSDAFCEGCGATLTPSAPPPVSTPNENSTQTRRLGSRNSEVITCPACGGTIDVDGYCQTCGTKAPSARDHYFQTPAPWIAGVCDRGQRHPRNEDAMALWAAGNRAVLVVCDGVSTSTDPDTAATVAAQTICDHLVGRLLDADADLDYTEAFTAAAAAGNQAVVAITAPDSPNAASATLAVAVIDGDELHYANLGDSRVYFLGQHTQELLTLDDSMAQAFIERGMERAEAEALPRAHAITKWVGRDSPDVVPRIGTRTLTEPGWVAVCSDGLWNYASAPHQLAAQLAATGKIEPIDIAKSLVAWANAKGGRDNITVALASFSGLTQPTNLGVTDPVEAQSVEGEV
jgi:serine/threonine protein phosphatase PrpC